MASLTTKDGIEVRPGQMWRDLDKRMTGRLVRVVCVDSEGYATVQACAPNGRGLTHRTTRLAIKRMHKHSTGWQLAITDSGIANKG